MASLSALGYQPSPTRSSAPAFQSAVALSFVRESTAPPLDVMVRGTPEQVEAWARECVRKTGGRGLILSAGGSVSPGTPAEAIDAVVKATKDG